MNNLERWAKRSSPRHKLLPGEQDLAALVLRALWFPLVDSTHLEFSFEARSKTLRRITTRDVFPRAVHDHLAPVCTVGAAAVSVAAQRGNAGAR